jgi:hypothetical protein
VRVRTSLRQQSSYKRSSSWRTRRSVLCSTKSGIWWNSPRFSKRRAPPYTASRRLYALPGMRDLSAKSSPQLSRLRPRRRTLATTRQPSLLHLLRSRRGLLSVVASGRGMMRGALSAEASKRGAMPTSTTRQLARKAHRLMPPPRVLAAPTRQTSVRPRHRPGPKPEPGSSGAACLLQGDP